MVYDRYEYVRPIFYEFYNKYWPLLTSDTLSDDNIKEINRYFHKNLNIFIKISKILIYYLII
jgi:hypothetical protein